MQQERGISLAAVFARAMNAGKALALLDKWVAARKPLSNIDVVYLSDIDIMSSCQEELLGVPSSEDSTSNSNSDTTVGRE